MQNSRPSDGSGLLALIIVMASTIVILAFFFTFSIRNPYVFTGAPKDEETSRPAITQTFGNSDRLDTSARTEDKRSKIIREDGLFKIATTQ